MNTTCSTIARGGLGFFVALVTLSAAGQVITVDNTDPGFSVLSETWSTANVEGQHGTDYRYRSTSSAPGSVEWRPTLPHSGEYQVFVWYRSGYDRPSNAHYTVEHAGGSTDVYVDQRDNGSQWYPIGAYSFTAGSSGRVLLTSQAEAGKSIVADAARFYNDSPTGPLAPEVRACWLTQYYYLGKTEAQIRQIAQSIKAGRMNTVYVGLYTGGTVYWPSKVFKNAGGSWASSSTDYAQWLTDIFHSEGLKVGAWFEYGFALTSVSAPIAVANPDWLARDQSGNATTSENGGFVFISPGSADGVNFVVGMLRELAENYNFDDIQVDRFRWGKKSVGREFGYEACTVALYHAQYGVNPPTNTNNSTWVAFRENLVNQAMHQAYDAIKAINPEIVVSAAPVGSYGITQLMQRWSAWANGGYIDLVMPQMYMTSLSSFQTEFNTQKSQAPAHLDLLGVGYRAQEDSDWSLVASQLNYARSQGVPHACLWVYHQYTSQVAIQDEIDHLPEPGQPWEQFAYNPFVSDRMLQIVVDNRDSAPAYVASGTWSNSSQTDYFRFDSRVAAGGTSAAATWSAPVPKSGRYDVYVWYSAASNRNDEAQYTVQHYNGSAPFVIDQRSNGGKWIRLGRWIFESNASVTPVVALTTEGSVAGEYTSADAAKLVLSGYALGDADGNGVVDEADFQLAATCLTGPGGGPIGSNCEAADFDDDTDVDLADFVGFQQRFDGP